MLTEHFQCIRQLSHLIVIALLQFYTVLIPILQMRKLRKTDKIAQVYQASKWQSLDSKLAGSLQIWAFYPDAFLAKC